MPNIREIKLAIKDELHKRPQSGHPGHQKMITMIEKDFFWTNMEKEAVEYLAHSVECEQVKSQHKHPAGLLQPPPIPEWK